MEVMIENNNKSGKPRYRIELNKTCVEGGILTLISHPTWNKIYLTIANYNIGGEGQSPSTRMTPPKAVIFIFRLIVITSIK